MAADDVNESSFLQAIGNDDETEGARLVYADWLEEHGEFERAEFLRVECELHRLGSDAPHNGPYFKLRHRFQDLSKKLDGVWISKVWRSLPEPGVTTKAKPAAAAPPAEYAELPLAPATLPTRPAGANVPWPTEVRSVFDVPALPTQEEPNAAAPRSSKFLIAFLVIAAIALAYAEIRDRMKNDHYIDLGPAPTQ